MRLTGGFDGKAGLCLVVEDMKWISELVRASQVAVHKGVFQHLGKYKILL